MNQTIDVAYNRKTKTFGTLVGVPTSPDIIPFRNMSARQREAALHTLFPVRADLARHIENSNSFPCCELPRLWQQVASGKVPINPLWFEALLTEAKIEFNVAMNRGCDHYIPYI